MFKHGDWNMLVVVVGLPETGKTTWIGQQVSALLKVSYVFAHDLRWSLGRGGSWNVYGKGNLPTARYTDAGQVAKGLRSGEKKVHVLDTPDGGDVLKLARMVGRKSLDSGNGKGWPTVCIWDEVMNVKGVRPQRLDGDIEAFISTRRHDHTGLIVGAQAARNMHYLLLTNATLVVMFRQVGDQNLQRLVDNGAPERLVKQLPELPNYRYLTYVPGQS